MGAWVEKESRNTPNRKENTSTDMHGREKGRKGCGGTLK